MIRLFLILFFSFSFFWKILSQSQDTINLEDVEVISSIVDSRQKKTLRSVSIITPEELNASNVSSVDEIIRFIPGLETQSRNLYGVQSDYSIRGSTFNQVLVMIDGMRLNDPLTGHFSSYVPIPLSEISRIEVIRGPASIMYGPDAVGGVINIITKNTVVATDSIHEVNIRTGGGQFEFLHTDAGFSGNSGKLSYSTGCKFLSSGGYPVSDGNNYDFRLRSGTASILFLTGEKFKFSFRTAIDGREFNARRFYTISLSDTARENVITWWNHMNGIYFGKKSLTTFDLAVKTLKDDYIFNSLTASNIHHTSQIITQIKNRRELSYKLTLTTGIQTYYCKITSNDRGNHDEISGGVYAMSYYSPGKYTNISGGLRLEYNRIAGFEILPQINGSYKTGNITFRGLAGKTTRTPDFTERYVSTNLMNLAAGRNLGNPDLLPERSWSLEAGSEIKTFNNLYFEITAFKRFGFDIIDYVLTQGSEINTKYPLIADGKYFYAKNISDLKFHGIEIILTTHYKPGNNSMIFTSLGYTFQQPVSSQKEISKYISNQAQHLLLLNLKYTIGRIGVFINGMYKQRNPEYAEAISSSLIKNYWLFNMQTEYGIMKDKLNIEFRIDNIFNTEYSDILGAELPGRWISLGIKYKTK